MKTRYSFLIIAILLGITSIASAQLSILKPNQGGTGIGSASVIGTCLKVLTISPFAYTLGSCGSGSGGGGSDSNWTFFNGSGIQLATSTNQVLIGGTSTTTSAALEVIGNGYFSNRLGIGTTTPGSILSIQGVGNFQAPTSTLYSNLRVANIFATSTITTTGLTTTGFTINGQQFTNLLGTGLSNSAGVLTVSSVPNSALQNSTISGIALGLNLADLTAGDSTLTFSGAYNGGTARTIVANCVAITGSASLCDGSDATGGTTLKNPFDVLTIGGTAHQSSSTDPFYFGKGLLTASTTAGVGTFGSLIATSSVSLPPGSITNTMLQNSSITINTASPLGGGGAVALGGTLNLTCTGCPTFGYPFPANATSSVLTFSNAPIFSSLTGVLKGNGASALTIAANGTDFTLITGTTCSGTDKVSAITAGGSVTCSADQSGGGGGGSDSNWNFFNGSGIRLATTTNQVLIGASATTSSAALEVIGNGYFSNRLGIGTTTPQWDLQIASTTTPLLVLTDRSATTTSPFNASMQNLTISNIRGGLSIGSVNATTSATSTWLWVQPRGANIRLKYTSGAASGQNVSYVTGGNIVIGDSAAPNIITDANNFPTKGLPNVIIGFQAGKNIQSVLDNPGVNGFTADAVRESAYDLTAIGGQALTRCTSCAENTAVGSAALFSLSNSYMASTSSGYSDSNMFFTQGTGNTAVGVETGILLGSDTTASSSWNAFFGNNTFSGIEGAWNAIFGSEACYLCTGDFNVVIGGGAVAGNLTTNTAMAQMRNVIIGGWAYGSGFHNNIATSTNDNIAIGYNVLPRANSTRQNTVVGWRGGPQLTYGNNNIFLGYQAGAGLTTESSNIVIGNNIALTPGTENSLDIANIIYGTGLTAFTATSTTISTGNIGIGTTTPGSLLSLSNLANFTTGTSTFYSLGGFNLTGGGCYAINGTCLSGSAGLGTVNSGTPNQVPYYASNGTTLAATSSLQILNSGRVYVSATSTLVQVPFLVSASTTPLIKTGNAIAEFNSDGNDTILTILAHGGNIGRPGISGLSSRGTTNSPSAALTDDTLLFLAGGGYGATAYTANVADIKITASQNWTNTNQGTNIIFETNPDNSSFARAERARIDNAGHFLIGTTTSSSTLAIQSIANFQAPTSTMYTGLNLTSGCFAINGTCISGSGGGAVSSVSNSDSTLTISPTTGAVVASLNLANPNTWTGLQDFRGFASSTLFSALNGIYVGTTATTTLLGNNATSTINGDLSFPNNSTGAGRYIKFRVDNGSGAMRTGLVFTEDGTNAMSILYDGSGSGINNKLIIRDEFTSAELFTFNKGGYLGISSSTPWGMLSVENLKGTTNNNIPAFVVASNGTSTPHFLINANGNSVFGGSSGAITMATSSGATGGKTVLLAAGLKTLWASGDIASTTKSFAGFAAGQRFSLPTKAYGYSLDHLACGLGANTNVVIKVGHDDDKAYSNNITCVTTGTTTPQRITTNGGVDPYEKMFFEIVSVSGSADGLVISGFGTSTPPL